MFSVTRFFQSLKYAFRGLRHVYKSEQNFRAQTITGIIVIIAAIYFPLKVWEIIVIILLIFLVLLVEILNTVVEYISDLLKPRLHHYVYVIKDIMAGAVLITALTALIVGLIIFLPYFINLGK